MSARPLPPRCHQAHYASPNAYQPQRARLRHGGDATAHSRRGVVVTRIEESGRGELGRIEDVDDPVVVEITLQPGRRLARIELAQGQEVGDVENIDRPVDVGVARGRVGDGQRAATDAFEEFGYKLGGREGRLVGKLQHPDENLDGKVDNLDIAVLVGDSPFNTIVSGGWGAGDFNYDGVYDALDVSAMVATVLYDTGRYLPQTAAVDPNAPITTTTTARRKFFATLP